MGTFYCSGFEQRLGSPLNTILASQLWPLQSAGLGPVTLNLLVSEPQFASLSHWANATS